MKKSGGGCMHMISIRVPQDIAMRLKTMAALMKRSNSFVALEAIQEYLDLHEWQLKAIQEGIQAADQGRLVDFEQFKKEWYASHPETD
jgi:RHH-type transcriptional regulator, rel operon repressor / antitoxin RelB